MSNQSLVGSLQKRESFSRARGVDLAANTRSSGPGLVATVRTKRQWLGLLSAGSAHYADGWRVADDKSFRSLG